MKIIRDFSFSRDEDSRICAALGYFDGVHTGHRKIIEQTMTGGFDSAVITFANQPAAFIDRNRASERIMSLDDKISVFESLGVQYLFLYDFDETIMNMSAEDFFERFILRFGIKKAAAGFNFRFGRNREGSSAVLEEMCRKNGIESAVIQPVLYKNEVVSSSLIKKMLAQGSTEDACGMLGRAFYLKGSVVHGNKLGSRIGIPTINIAAEEGIIIPKNGVYESRTEIRGRMYHSLTNIGINPTVNNKAVTVETHIIGFSDDVYGENVRVEFAGRIRDEQKFSGIEELREQILKDISAVKKKNRL